MSTVVTSIIDGAPVSGVADRAEHQPGTPDEVVGEVSFADAGTFVQAAESASKAQPSWAACRLRYADGRSPRSAG